MDLNLAGKTAVVTGASRGIGLAVVDALTREGVRVVGAARTITNELEALRAIGIPVDLGTSSGGAFLIGEAQEALGGIDFLVNNLGVSGTTFDFLNSDDDEWATALDVNLLSAVRTTRAALPSIIARRGAIVNISSTAARLPGNAPASYGAAKAALTAFGKAISEQFGAAGVRVNTVSPGLVRTPVYDAAAEQMGITVEELSEQLVRAQNIASGRMSESAEVADLVCFLLSERAGNITGAEYIIDGGGMKTV